VTAFAGAGAAFADLRVQAQRGGSSLAMVTEKRIWEGTMAVRKSEDRTGTSWVMWALGVAGVTLLVVELNAGMAYVEAGLQENLTNLGGWLPAAGMFTLKMAANSIWLRETWETLLHTAPLAALGFVLVGLGVGLNRRSGTSIGRKENR
jgi:hypothetical protein